MVFSGYRVLKRVTMTLGNALGFEYALGPAALDGNFGLHQPFDFKGRSYNLPGQASQFPREDLSEGFDLLVSSGRLHDEDALPVTLVNGFRPGDDRCTLQSGEIDAAA